MFLIHIQFLLQEAFDIFILIAYNNVDLDTHAYFI